MKEVSMLAHLSSSNIVTAMKSRKGFTLIELLVVIGILAVLLAIVLIAINPARQFSQANNTKRASDVNAILNAIHQYGADNRGNLTALGIDTTAEEINNTNTAGLCAALVTEYIAALPTDPTLNTDPILEAGCAAYATGYSVARSATDNRITVSAPSAENGQVISVTR
jgi:type IV pilus assembly protein PilA